VHTPSERLAFINERIVVRHEELARAVTVLSRASDRLERRGRNLRLATIVLGAFSASQGVTVAKFGASTAIVTSLVFAASGIAIAAIAGIEAAFKFESRSTELRMLAAKCQAARFQHNSEWSYRIAIAEPSEALDAAHDLLTVQDKALAEAQLEAARLGLNIALSISGRYGDGDYDPQLGRRADGDLPPHGPADRHRWRDEVLDEEDRPRGPRVPGSKQ
jgi:hypothetical protein